MRKIICVKQRDITDCGAACLASVAAAYKLHMPVSRIRQIAGTDKKGTNVIGLIEAAEKMGMQARGAKGSPESLQQIPLPAIAHLIIDNKWHHYVVICKVGKKIIRYMDPASGHMIRKTREDFLSQWSGVIVLITPGENFKPGNHLKSASSRFWELVRPHKTMMLQALIGAIVFTLLGLTTSVYVQKIVDHVLVDTNLRLLNLLSVVMLVLTLFQFILGSLKSAFALRTGQHIDSRLIVGYYRHLLNLPQHFFDTMRVGEIISRVNDAVKIRAFVNDIALSLIVNFLIIMFSIVMMFMYYWKLALIMLLIIPVYIVLYKLSNYLSKRQQRELMETGANLETQLVESLTAAGTIKKFTLEKFASLKTEELFGKLLKSISGAGMSSIVINNGTEFVTRIFTIVLLWCGSYFVINRELSPGELLSFYALIGYLTSPAATLIAANRQIQDALIAADRLYEIIDLAAESNDSPETSMTITDQGEIHFEEIDFRYGTRSKVFEKLSLRFRAGTSTAVVGESGSGKSTLAALLLRLYEPAAGKITIGGVDIKMIDRQQLRNFISIVPQQTDLFADSIIANIALGSAEPDLGKIVGLCQMLGISSFIESLPMHYHTLLNENGLNLSGGQRQRLAIARALYRDPEILILDEATSSLDPLSEQYVQATLEWFRAKGKTVIIIAHRLSTIKHCDMIHVLEKGILIESGTHHSLLAANGAYTKLWHHHSSADNG